MIAQLSGIFADFGPDWAVIEVGGVGYLVHCSAKTLAGLGTRGDAVTVHTQLQVSENDMRLIGFASAGEREWFRLLTGVQGVGSKMALAVLSAPCASTAALPMKAASAVSIAAPSNTSRGSSRSRLGGVLTSARRDLGPAALTASSAALLRALLPLLRLPCALAFSATATKLRVTAFQRVR